MILETIPNDYIVNPTMELMGVLQSDFVLKAGRIKNDSPEPIVITEITYTVYAQKNEIKKITYTDLALENYIAAFQKEIKNLKEWDSKVMIGVSNYWDKELVSNTTTLLPNQEIGIINEFFLVVYNTPVDQLKMTVCYSALGKTDKVETVVPVIDYKTKNSYIFPVRGTWQVNGNYDCIGAHRTQYSMEFAFDLVQLGTNRPSAANLFKYEETGQDKNYISFGADVLAIADGEVVDCFNDATWRVDFPHDDATAEEKEARNKVKERFGRLPIQCGNYVVLKHENDEYSFYGHMIYHSLIVKTGDMVKQGQKIGQLGNTGKSGCPHLHFHIMNGADYYSARGLPIRFTNIMDGMGESLSLIKEEYTLVITK